jgi:hypothetical protein
MKQKKLRIEKRGEHGSCEVVGWRYEGDSVWHVKVWPDNRDVRRHAYKVISGVFEPEAASHAEREAVMHLIEKWESEQTKIRPSRLGSSPTLRFADPA